MMKHNFLKSTLVVLLIAVTTVTNVFAQNKHFNKSKDLLLAQFDLKPDEDDLHAAAALACMLQHPDLDGINYYAVAGAYGVQNGKFITSGIPDYYNLLFGEKNTHWTDAHNEWDASVERIHIKAKATLNGGGKIFVQEAGQSDITHDWCKALIKSGVDPTLIKSNVIVVQHSDWNEKSATDAKLEWVMKNTTYVKIEDGNGDNATPNYNNKNTKWLTQAKSENNPNSKARKYWTAADEIISNWEPSWENPTIRDGGVDYSDCCEIWYIFNIGNKAWTVEQFWTRYVVNEPR